MSLSGSQAVVAGRDERIIVPGITYETSVWTPANHVSNRKKATHSGEYSSAIPPFLADLRFELPSSVVADIAEVTDTIARFDQYTHTKLGTELGPMATILLRTESASSSQIENLTVGARQLALAEIGESGSSNAAAVIANVHAMETAISLSSEVKQDSILDMHRALLENDALLGSYAGHYREELVWIGGDDAGPRGAVYVAPQHERIDSLMSDLVAFVNRTDVPALAHAAIAHAQFETIHPFVDGNGRTGRALVHAMLKAAGATRYATVPVSSGLLTNTEAYFGALGRYRAGDATPIIDQFCNAARFAAEVGTQLVDDLAQAVEHARENITARSDALVWRVLPTLVSQPVVDASYLCRRFQISGVAAQRVLNTLADAGVVTERTGYRRNRVWQFDDGLDALDEFAARIRRPAGE